MKASIKLITAIVAVVSLFLSTAFVTVQRNPGVTASAATEQASDVSTSTIRIPRLSFGQALVYASDANAGDDEIDNSYKVKRSSYFSMARQSKSQHLEPVSKRSRIARGVILVGAFAGAFTVGTHLGGYAVEKARAVAKSMRQGLH